MGPLLLSSSVKANFFCILTLLQKRDIIWCKLPLGNTSPPSTAIFLYDGEENLVFQVVMHLINLPLITHLTTCDAVGHINFMVITRFHVM